MIEFKHLDSIIKIKDESDYSDESKYKKLDFAKRYFSAEGEVYRTSMHSVAIYKKDEKINSCLVIGSGGLTGVYENSYLLDGNNLVICCGDSVFSLSIPTLDLNWVKEADSATCFEIFKMKDEYIIHGELSITRLNREGEIVWQVGGRDIFVLPEGDDGFKIEGNFILAKDWERNEYKFNFDTGEAVT